jgi:hypothetical protein
MKYGILVISDHDNVDFVVMTSVYYGLARVGGEVERYKQKMDVKGAIRLCLCGHGEPGKVQSFTADQIAETLADPVTGCKDTLSELLITCCSAGCDNGGPGTSVVDVICGKLQIKDMVIRGALGPSIKANVFGDMFRAINEGADPGLKQAFATQTSAIKNDTTLQKENLGDSNGKFVKRFDLTKITDFAAVARECDSLTRQFYQDFIKKLEMINNELLPKDKTMRAVHWDGSKVVEGKPSNGLHVGVSMSFAAMRSMNGLPQNV